MAINLTEFYSGQKCIRYDFEEVMFRWDVEKKAYFKKFYDETECGTPTPPDNRLLNDALRFGDLINRSEYDFSV